VSLRALFAKQSLRLFSKEIASSQKNAPRNDAEWGTHFFTDPYGNKLPPPAIGFKESHLEKKASRKQNPCPRKEAFGSW
jgi:hypothetical protein